MRISTLLFVALGAGCAPQIYSPAVRPAVIESAATVGEGHIGMQGAVSAHNVFPFNEDRRVDFGAAGRLRVGVAEKADAFVEGSTARIYSFGGGASVAGDKRWVVGAAAGAKIRLLDFVSVMGAMGGGRSRTGYYVGPEVGVVAGLERYPVVPFGGVRVGLSVPISPEPIDVEYDDFSFWNDDEDLTTAPMTPRPTLTVAFTAGGGRAILRRALGRCRSRLGTEPAWFRRVTTALRVSLFE